MRSIACRLAVLSLIFLIHPTIVLAEAARNMAPLAEVTASSELSPRNGSRYVTNGILGEPGTRRDVEMAWAAAGNEHPDGVTLTFVWDEPVTVDTIVYYGRTVWNLNECWKDYEIHLDDAAQPVAKGEFKRGHGPQPVHLPQRTQARKLVLKLLTHYGGHNPGASEVQIFSSRPAATDLIGVFSTFEMDFRYAYYPSNDLVRIFVPTPPEDTTNWHLSITPAAGGGILAEAEGALPMANHGESISAPELPEGMYRLRLTLTGGEEPVIEERVFQKRQFEWEGLELGLDDVVVPPFEPLTADAETSVVTSVLREHTHAATGLWEQVLSQERPLLAAPVRLEATIAGQAVVAEGRELIFDTVKETQVTGSAGWSAGALTGRIEFDYDYDGMKMLTLYLDATNAEIERLQLVIPLRASEAWLMHPVTNGLRHHYAGRVPQGEGKVWDSVGVSRQGLPKPLLPYIFVGGPERGICYAADNDRDWIIDPEHAAVEIDRDGDTVNLRLNLIAKPARLTRDRTIRFALQATPAKPMPEEPYNWRRWWATGTDRQVEDVQINFWGGNMYWGGRHFATSVFPAFEDYGFFEQLAENRRTGRFNRQYFDEWMERFANVRQDQLQSLRSHFQAGLQWAAGAPLNTEETTRFRYVIPYINARGISHENPAFMTYMDEWITGDIADPRWHRYSDFQRPKRLSGFACWYQIEPVDSYIDMMLFYHKKMLETFAEGIYWDNFFLQPCYVPSEAGGPAYIDDAGNLRPGVNLMGFRNFVKRTATMMHQMEMRPLTYIHMTNVNIVPMLSFATLHLDWEWRDQGHYAILNMQDRLRVDDDTALVLVMSLGLQTGNISIGIDRFHPPRDSGVTRDWLFRTVMAVCMPHEIKVHQGGREVRAVQTHLANFGYGQPECRVYRYWEDGFPLTTTGANNHALVLARDERAMLAIGNFGPGDEPQAVPAEDGPTLEEYDAGQRGEGVAEEEVVDEQPAEEEEIYQVTLVLDLEALGLPESVRAFDLEKNREELERVEPGVFRMNIKKHDFALVLVE